MFNLETMTSLITVIGAFFAGGAGKMLLDVIKERNATKLTENQAEAKQRLDANDQAFALYKTMVETLNNSVDKLQNEFRKLEAEHVECHQKNAELNGNLKALEVKVEMMNNYVQPLVMSINDNQKVIMTNLAKLVETTQVAKP